MLRPNSAFYYMNDLTQISNELLDLMERNQDSSKTVKDIAPFLYKWALESVGDIFLDTR